MKGEPLRPVREGSLGIMKKRTGEGGSVMVAVLVVIMLVGGLSGTMLMGALGGQRSTSAAVEASSLLFVAESGLDYNFVQMRENPHYAIENLAFQLDTTDQTYVSPVLTLDSGARQQSFQYEIQYLEAGVPVAFASRSEPEETFDEIKVTCTASSPRSTRVVAGWYSVQVLGAVRGAVVSDMIPTGTSGSGESLARKGHVVFDDADDDEHVIFGDVLTNGFMKWDSTHLTEGNIGSYLSAHDGEILKELDGTEDELPDFTDPGGSDQLFDFERYRAAAAAGAGQIFTGLSAFQTAMNNANSVGDKLEGITVVEVDPAVEGASPAISSSEIPDGIHITGTLVFLFANGTDPTYELNINTPLNINAADLDGWDRNDEGTYTTGYPGTYDDPTKKPSEVNIEPVHENFLPNDDLPALMLNNAMLDLAAPANVCGVVYGPSYIEIDNNGSSDQRQYFNGAIYVGGGICFEGEAGVKAVRYDPNTVNRLQTKDGKGASLTRIGYSIIR